ncbi:MAG: transglycosylase domain-containing protein [Planctomycetes bacterium]|nr:transglycosylase domain-containing protein [Planctomycetota bacterium]
MVVLVVVGALVGPPLLVEGAAWLLAYPDERPPTPAPSTMVLARDGQVLASYTAEDGRWYLPVATGQHGRWLPLAVEAVEDARFRSHAGVDWFAAYTAIGQNFLAGRVVRGSSTITMQVERLRHPRPRTYMPLLVQHLRHPTVPSYPGHVSSRNVLAIPGVTLVTSARFASLAISGGCTMIRL